jgi:ABC-type glutathione transport system ATPase component
MAEASTPRRRGAAAPLIRLSRVSKTYPAVTSEPVRALEDVTLDVDDGEFVSIRDAARAPSCS